MPKLRTASVRDLVADALSAMPQPYGDHVIDEVFVAIEASPALLARYEGCAVVLGSKNRVNMAVGQWVKKKTGYATVAEVTGGKNKLSPHYSILKSRAAAEHQLPSPPNGQLDGQPKSPSRLQAGEKSSQSFEPWLTFEERLAAMVKELAGNKIRFTAGRQCIPGFPVDGFRADAALTDGHRLLAVEVEVRQAHPDTNVGKYWLLASHKQYDKVVLLHVYTPAYNSYGWRKTLGEFYATKMSAELPFEYVCLDRRRDTNCDDTLAEVFALIRSRAMVLFES